MKETIYISVGMYGAQPGGFLRYRALEGNSIAKWHGGTKIDDRTATVLIDVLFDVTDVRIQDYNKHR